MPYPKIINTKTEKFELGETVYELQELPWHAVTAVARGLGDVILAAVKQAAKYGPLNQLEWYTLSEDEDGKEKKDWNITLITDVAVAALQELDNQEEFILSIVDYSLVGEKGEKDAVEAFRNIRLADMVSALKIILTLNLGTGLGERLKAEAEKAAAAATPETDGLTSSSASGPENTTSLPTQPGSPSTPQMGGPPQPASAEKPPLSAPGTPPSTSTTV